MQSMFMICRSFAWWHQLCNDTRGPMQNSASPQHQRYLHLIALTACSHPRPQYLHTCTATSHHIAKQPCHHVECSSPIRQVCSDTVAQQSTHQPEQCQQGTHCTCSTNDGIQIIIIIKISVAHNILILVRANVSSVARLHSIRMQILAQKSPAHMVS